MRPTIHSVDVVIPAYNASAYITQTLQSVADQDYPIANIIVVNDGSTDNTKECVLAFCVLNKHLNILLINQNNAGLSAARNKGIKLSKADFIAFLDADDLWNPKKVSEQILLFEKNTSNNVGIIYCGYQLIDDHNKLLHPDLNPIIPPTIRGDVYKALLRGNFISGSGSSVLIKRAIFNNVEPFDEKLQSCEDWDMWLRISKKYHFDFVNKNLVSIRLHRDNMQKDSLRMLSGELMVLNKFIERGEDNHFLLWKIRTYLFNKGLNPEMIPGFTQCLPKLQQKLSGWRMKIALFGLYPARVIALIYLKIRSQ